MPKEPIVRVRCASCFRTVKGRAMSGRIASDPSGPFPFKHMTPLKTWCPGTHHEALPLAQSPAKEK